MSSDKRVQLRRMLRPFDYAVLAIVLLAGIGSSVYIGTRRMVEDDGCEAVVEVDGRTVYTHRLQEGRPDSSVHLDLPGGMGILRMSGTRIRVLPMPDSTCPLHICSRTGWIERPGQFIACVPNRLIITIRGPAKPDSNALDATTP